MPKTRVSDVLCAKCLLRDSRGPDRECPHKTINWQQWDVSDVARIPTTPMCAHYVKREKRGSGTPKATA